MRKQIAKRAKIRRHCKNVKKITKIHKNAQNTQKYAKNSKKIRKIRKYTQTCIKMFKTMPIIGNDKFYPVARRP